MPSTLVGLGGMVIKIVPDISLCDSKKRDGKR